jgi:small-conductance mechanosensitive channel
MIEHFGNFWQDISNDLHHPDLIWQIVVLVVAMLFAKFAESFVHERARGVTEEHGRAWRMSQGGLKRLIFPVIAFLLVYFARLALHDAMHTRLLMLALPLLASLAIIRLVFYILRLSFASGTWLAGFERIFSTIAWLIVALHILGFLPGIIDGMEAIAFPIGKTKLNLWQILQGTITVAATLLVALWLSNTLEARLNAATGLDTSLRIVMIRLGRALLTVLAVLIALPLVGIDVTTLSVFSGALGVGLGFGLQKIASNYVAGFILLLDHSIRIGDIIGIDASNRGQVTRITTRFTVLRTLTGSEILVPNEVLIGSVVRNDSFSDRQVRVPVPVQIAYGSDLELAMRLMADAARAHPRVLSTPSPDVLLLAFADSGINLELGCWITDPEKGLGGLRSDVNLAIWRSFKANGIEIPFPQREVRILNNDTNTGATHV